MIRVKDSFTVVLNGDWNSLYIQPNWIAKHIFENEVIEIGINYTDGLFSVLLSYNNVVIDATQSKVIFSASNSDAATISLLCKCVRNYLDKANTTSLTAYGLNSKFIDDGEAFASLLDSMADKDSLIEAGCRIESTRIARTVNFNGSLYNIDSFLEADKLLLQINEHHEGPFDKEHYPVMNTEFIERFFDNCSVIIQAMGYEKEDEEL